ncbi:DUF2777 domain-containing protein [Robertmurraya sp. DFI.2.37]|uniref:DUF2777 domain-containing protein n=1 Tax=unclassified Robertmurraya TaxID=2837524 RepID=UPI000BA7DC73|nr:DUF2777 domain-containing protein [Robertmurraya sp. DFI.2.37]MDF1507389.1 DUF2777 domain-containing protein [Robertmurraya sp. DFI.2.37]PAE20784.1 hypothetical protein CHH80_10015 [Bacillus sp. 7504-2]
MNRQQRSKLIEFQIRAYIEGTIEYINDQWVFFENESEEASLLEEYLHQELEVLRHSRWRKGVLFEDGKMAMADEILLLKSSDTLRIRKNLIYSLERLLEEISDDAFYQFITHLNSLHFSVYDCIYCYNHLTFLKGEDRKEGVNFIIFDNQEDICSIQHHFCYYEKKNDRFEFTLNNGKRTIIEKLSS